MTIRPRLLSNAVAVSTRRGGVVPVENHNGYSLTQASHPSCDWLLPSSQSSPGSTVPLPQTKADVQSCEHVLPGGSHASPGSRIPSPHGAVQSRGQPSPETLLPSS